MARSVDAIQRDIERTRNQLAKTLDELAVRAAPKNLAEGAKSQALDAVKEPKFQIIAGGVVLGVAVLTGLVISSRRKERRQIKEIQRLLAAIR